MNHKNVYDLTVRGETVHLEFTRINDSRRVPEGYSIHKKPNYFHVRGAVKCTVDIPSKLAPEWWTQKFDSAFPTSGYAFCFHRDKWDMRKGRHESLADALNYAFRDEALCAEIVEAFTAMEQKRTKVKGPARTPKSAKPKHHPSLRQILVQLQETLNKLSQPPVYSIQPTSPQPVFQYIEEKFRPAESEQQ